MAVWNLRPGRRWSRDRRSFGSGVVALGEPGAEEPDVGGEAFDVLGEVWVLSERPPQPHLVKDHPQQGGLVPGQGAGRWRLDRSGPLQQAQTRLSPVQAGACFGRNVAISRGVGRGLKP